MGGLRKPTNLLRLTGADKKNPKRFAKQNRQNEPRDLGPITIEPPDWMGPLQQEYYINIVNQCPKNVLTNADIQIVETLALLLARNRVIAMDPEQDFSANIIGKIFSGLSHLGMTPASRSKVSAVNRDENAKENPLSEFAA